MLSTPQGESMYPVQTDGLQDALSQRGLEVVGWARGVRGDPPDTINVSDEDVAFHHHMVKAKSTCVFIIFYNSGLQGYRVRPRGRVDSIPPLLSST